MKNTPELLACGVIGGNRAREQHVAFWSELTKRVPSLVKLERIGLDLQEYNRVILQRFDRMLRLHPASTVTLRSYAEYAAEVSVRVFKSFDPSVSGGSLSGS